METEDEDATVTLGITIPVDPCKQILSKEDARGAAHSSESDDSPFNRLNFCNLPHFLDPNLGIIKQLLSSDIPHQIGTYNTWNIEPYFLDILPLSNRCFTEDSILIFGGFDPSTVLEKNPPEFDHDDFVLGKLLQYLLDSKIWNYYGTMIEPRCYHGCALDGQYVYIIGGYSLLQCKYGEMLAIATTDRLNLDDGQWKRCANMTRTRASLAVVSHQGSLYVFGGRDSNGNILESVEIYCPEQDTWTEITSLPHPSMGLSAVCVMDAIWLIGGITYNTSADHSKYTFADQSKCLLSSVYLFVPSTRRWYNEDPLPFACAFSSCVSNYDSLWLIGGCKANKSNGGTLVSSSAILKLTLSEKPSKWKKVATLMYPRHALTALLHDECIYVFAGIESMTKNASDKIEVIDTIANINIECNNIPVAVAGCTSVLILEETAMCRTCNYSFIQDYSEISDLCERDDYFNERRSEQDIYEDNSNIYRPSESYLKSDLDSEISKETIFADSIRVEDSIVPEGIKETVIDEGSFEDHVDPVFEIQTKSYQDPRNVRYRASMEIFLNSTMSDDNLPQAPKKNKSSVSKWLNYLHNLRSDEKLHQKVFQSSDPKMIVKTEMSDMDSHENYKCAEVQSFEDKSSDDKCETTNGIISSSTVPTSHESFMYVQSNIKSESLTKKSSTINLMNDHDQSQTSVNDVSTKISNLEMNKFANISTDTEKIDLPAESFPIILLMGGLSRPYDKKSRSILSYHWVKNMWKTVGNMLEDCCHHSVVFLNNKLYIIGGFQAKDSRSYKNITKRMFCYDISEEAWYHGPEMKYARAFHSALVFEKEIYVLGGRDHLGNILSSVEIYNDSNNEWRECNSLPYPVLGAAITVINSALYVLGGIMYEDENEVISYNTFVFDFMNKSWSLGPEMPIALAFCGIHSSRNFIWLFGGLKQEGLNIISSKDIIKFDGDTEDWTEVAELSAPRHAFVTLSLDTKAYIIGGYSTQEKKEVLTCEEMDLMKDEMLVIGSLPFAASGRAGVVIKKIF